MLSSFFVRLFRTECILWWWFVVKILVFIVSFALLPK
jgi:hypothetical protein